MALINRSQVGLTDGALLPIGWALVQDQKTTGTAGGTATGGVWNVRALNTEVYDTLSRISVASDIITFQPGTYLIIASAPNRRGQGHRLKLFDVTASPGSDLAFGPGSYSFNGATYDIIRASLTAKVVFASQTDVELQHYITVGIATTGLGLAVSDGSAEIYAEVEITVLD